MATREMMDEAFEEGETQQVMDELSNYEDVSLDDLRRFPGSADMSNADLQKLWDEAQVGDAEGNSAPASDSSQEAAAEKLAEASGGEAVQTARGWKVIDDKGKEIADFSKLSAAELMKQKFSYKANGAEHSKTLDEVFRVAQFGHFNEKKLGSVMAERNQFAKDLATVSTKAAGLERNERLVAYALKQFHLGDNGPLQKILEASKKALTQAPAEFGGQLETRQERSAPVDPDAEGKRVFETQIAPQADQIAAQYGAKAAEVRTAVLHLMRQEPNLTAAKIQSIINEEIPAYLESYGYHRGMQAAPVPGDEMAQMRAELAALKAQLGNQSTDALRARNKNLPGGDHRRGQGADGEEGSDAIPAEALTDRRSMRNFLRS